MTTAEIEECRVALYKILPEVRKRMREDIEAGDAYFYAIDGLEGLAIPETKKMWIVCSALTAVLSHCDDMDNLHPFSEPGHHLLEIIRASVAGALMDMQDRDGLDDKALVPPKWVEDD